MQAGDQPLSSVGDVLAAKNANELIDTRIHVQEFFFFPLSQAAADDHAAGAARFFQIDHLADDGMGLCAGITDEAQVLMTTKSLPSGSRTIL